MSVGVLAAAPCYVAAQCDEDQGHDKSSTGQPLPRGSRHRVDQSREADRYRNAQDDRDRLRYEQAERIEEETRTANIGREHLPPHRFNNDGSNRIIFGYLEGPELTDFNFPCPLFASEQPEPALDRLPASRRRVALPAKTGQATR